jgi:hypothetical protein
LVVALALLLHLKVATSTQLRQADNDTKKTAAILLPNPLLLSMVLLLYAEIATAAVEATVVRAAPYNLHTFSGQRRLVILSSWLTQVCILIVLPYALLADPFSSYAFGSSSAASVYGKCRTVLEDKVAQHLPGAEFMPGGFADFVLWLQLANALVSPLLHLLAPILSPFRWIVNLRSLLGSSRQSFRWEYWFSMEHSSAHAARTVCLAICYGESFLRVHWVAVPKAMGARRVNRRPAAAGAGHWRLRTVHRLLRGSILRREGLAAGPGQAAPGRRDRRSVRRPHRMYAAARIRASVCC